MGAIESTEAGNIWESATAEISRGIYREDESYRADRDEEAAVVRRERGREEAAAAAASSSSPAAAAAAASSSPAAAPAANGGEITTDVEAVEQSTAKSQKQKRISPAESKKTAEVSRVLRGYRSNRDVIFSLLFLLHLLLVTTGIIFLNVVYLKDMNRRKLHNLQRWFPQLGAAIVVGSLFASLWPTLFKRFPYIMARAVLWTSVILTFGASIMLICTSLPANLGVGVLWLIFAICLSLYACWVSERMKYAGNLLDRSLNTARKFHGAYLESLWVLLIASIWLVFWSFGVVSALTFKFAPLIILALIASLAWTLETLRNIVYTTIASGIARFYLDGQNVQGSHWKRPLHAPFTSLFGSICLGSLIVPILHCLRVVARGLNRIHRDNEFMFSCAGCFMGVMGALERYANNWAYVQVGVHNKPFTRASEDTWDMFKSKQLNVVIETDLTSSFCVLSGIAGGMLCVLVSGGWTFGTHKALTLSVSVVSFFIGYFLVRITMAVPQGAVATHYVCYGENSTGQEFSDSPVGERLKELLAEADGAANEV